MECIFHFVSCKWLYIVNGMAQPISVCSSNHFIQYTCVTLTFYQCICRDVLVREFPLCVRASVRLLHFSVCCSFSFSFDYLMFLICSLFFLIKRITRPLRNDCGHFACQCHMWQERIRINCSICIYVPSTCAMPYALPKTTTMNSNGTKRQKTWHRLIIVHLIDDCCCSVCLSMERKSHDRW